MTTNIIRIKNSFKKLWPPTYQIFVIFFEGFRF